MAETGLAQREAARRRGSRSVDDNTTAIWLKPDFREA
jgi:hypothetical protein